jgi:predicted extracellular nuclease
VFVNHLKSNFIADEFRLSPAEVAPEKQAITARRTAQAGAVAAILRRLRLKTRIVVCGDMNDDPAAATLSALTTAGLREHIQHATTIAGPSRTGTLIADLFAGQHPSMWTHRYRAD